MAARRAGDLDRRQPERPDWWFRPSRAKAPDRRIDGQPRAPFRRGLLVPVLPCDGALRRRAARRSPAEDRSFCGAEPEKRTRRARVCACLLRKRRTADRADLPVALARRLSARRVLLRSLGLASVAG